MKILMALMGLEIGGAETHVVELSKALSRRGHEVLVASGGGVYESALADVGIRHFRIPLHRRDQMLRALRLLDRLIREEKPDLVHAHARIPAFLCGPTGGIVPSRSAMTSKPIYSGNISFLQTRFSQPSTESTQIASCRQRTLHTFERSSTWTAVSSSALSAGWTATAR